MEESYIILAALAFVFYILVTTTHVLVAVGFALAVWYLLVKKEQPEPMAMRKPIDIDTEIASLMQVTEAPAEPIPVTGPPPTDKELYKASGCTSDNQIANRMKYMAMQPKISRDAATKRNTANLRQYYEEEAREQESRDWWDNETDYLDELM